MLGKKLINAGPVATGGANTFASENFNTVLYTGNGSTQRIGGYINRGAVFNGSSSKITNTGFSITGNRSVSFWVRMNSSSSQNTGILSTWNDGADYLEGITVRGGASNTNFVLSVDTTNHTIAALNTNWNHIAIIYDGTYYQAYFNGTQVLTNISVQSSIEKLSNLQLGARHTPTDTQYFSGKIDQVRVFDKALSSSEVTTLYGETHASTTISTTDIFSDNSGVALYQLDGNANDTGGVTGRTEGTESAIFSNADNSNFNLGNATVVNNSFGVSFWVKMNKISQSENVYLCSFMYGSNTSLYMDTSNVLQVSNGGYSRNESFSTTHTFAADTWYHIVYTGQIVGDGTLRCYVNGTQVGSRGWITGHNYTLTSGNRIGSYNNGDQSIDGQIADFRIYKSTHLSSSDVTALYSGTPPTTGLTEYYKFDGNDRNYAGDRQLTPSNVIYNYSGTATNVTYQEATKFQPDLVWLKNRGSSTYFHELHDSIRGASKGISSNSTIAEFTDVNRLTSFDSNGFSVGVSSDTNQSSNNYVAWCFKGGGPDVLNENGSINSQVSANQDAGFSIVSYAGNNGSSATIGHGLNSAPELVIIKARNLAAGWPTLAAPNGTIVYTRRLNDTGATDSSLGSVFFNSTAPTSSVFTVGGSDEVNDGYNYIAYCFHSVDGYSKIGSYTGNGSTSNIIETGFEPAFLLVKPATAVDQWTIVDNKRGATTGADARLFPSLSNAESSFECVDFMSNGFKITTNVGNGYNANNVEYIYLAIAADPDTTTPTVENSFDVVTYTGDGVNAKSVDVDFKPDLVWIKSRTSALSNVIHDSIRGSGPLLITDSTTAEINNGSNTVEFTEDGFDLQGGASHTSVNGADDFVAWCWKAGDHDDNLPQINTEGSIDSVVSVNAEAGFSIVKYTGEGATRTIGHGLSSAPEMMIIKNLDQSDGWAVYTSTTGSGQFMQLNESFAAGGAGDIFGTPNDVGVSPTSTVFTIGSNHKSGANGEDYIAYCFHSVSGYQKIGSYTGNASSTTVTTGFQPRFVMIKRTNAIGNWNIWDAIRNPSADDANNNILYPNKSDAETDAGSGRYISFDSNGFTISGDSGDQNANGSTYIYLAIK